LFKSCEVKYCEGCEHSKMPLNFRYSIILASIYASIAGASVYLLSSFIPTIKRFIGLRALKNAKLVRIGPITSLHLYPVKSTKGITLNSLLCGTFGVSPYSGSFIHDRGWMIVFGDGNRMVTIRQEPTLVLISVSFDEESESLTLTAPKLSPVTFTTFQSSSDIKSTRVFGTDTIGLDCGDEVANWISSFLEKPGHRLLRKCATQGRHIGEVMPYCDLDSRGDLKFKHISYQDDAPISVANKASLAALSAETGLPLTMDRFRPNIVVDGTIAWEEDEWDHLVFCKDGEDPTVAGKVVLRRVAPSTRCKVPTVDPETGIMDPKSEPQNTLVAIHGYESTFGTDRWKLGMKGIFGTFTGIVHDGTITVGDVLYVSKSAWKTKA